MLLYAGKASISSFKYSIFASAVYACLYQTDAFNDNDSAHECRATFMYGPYGSIIINAHVCSCMLDIWSINVTTFMLQHSWTCVMNAMSMNVRHFHECCSINGINAMLWYVRSFMSERQKELKLILSSRFNQINIYL